MCWLNMFIDQACFRISTNRNHSAKKVGFGKWFCTSYPGWRGHREPAGVRWKSVNGSSSLLTWIIDEVPWGDFGERLYSSCHGGWSQDVGCGRIHEVCDWPSLWYNPGDASRTLLSAELDRFIRTSARVALLNTHKFYWKLHKIHHQPWFKTFLYHSN